jgi:hypothetical protein
MLWGEHATSGSLEGQRLLEGAAMKSLAGLLGLAMLAGAASAADLGSGLIVLETHGPGALNLVGNSRIEIPARAVYVNSSNQGAISSVGNAVIDAPFIYLCGNAQFTGNATWTGAIIRRNTPYPDPLAGLVIPNGTGMTNYGNQSISGANTVVTLQPGMYGAITITSSPTITLASGVYVIGSLSVSGQARITGNGVALVMRTGSITISGGATISLTPLMEGGVLESVVIAQPPGNATQMSLSGGSAIQILGTIYAPDATVRLVGQGLMQGDGPQVGDMIISRRASLEGQGTIKIGRSNMTSVDLPPMPLFD